MTDAPYGLDSLNLDCMTIEDLAEIAEHLATLQNYARNKGRAMLLRAAGDVSRALVRERECEAIYKQLPDNWRW
jgi:hypothetical protein